MTKKRNNKPLLVRFFVIFGADEIADREYAVYGNMTTEKLLDINGREEKSFLLPEFENLEITVIADGEEKVFEKSLYSFSGAKIEPEDIMMSVACAAIRKDDFTYYRYMCPELKKLIAWYHKSSNMLSAGGNKYLKQVLHVNGNVYSLNLVTDVYLYYIYEDNCLMLDANTHAVVSDNHFAEEGFYNCIRNIKKGREKNIWNNVPTSVFDEDE